MESSGPTPTAAIADPSLTELVSREGPFLTVYLTTEAGIDNAMRVSVRAAVTVPMSAAMTVATAMRMHRFQASQPNQSRTLPSIRNLIKIWSTVSIHERSRVHRRRLSGNGRCDRESARA